VRGVTGCPCVTFGTQGFGIALVHRGFMHTSVGTCAKQVLPWSLSYGVAMAVLFWRFRDNHARPAILFAMCASAAVLCAYVVGVALRVGTLLLLALAVVAARACCVRVARGV
jgi:hypothetical protein